MQSFNFRTSAVDAQFLYWAEICGHHEITNYTCDQMGALRLVQSLVVDSGHGQSKSQILKLSLSDFDRIISRLHSELYSENFECQSDCGECGEAFEYTLNTDDLFQMKPPPSLEELGQGQYRSEQDWVFRLPSIEDLTKGVSGTDLLNACTINGEPPAIEIANELFEAIAPIGTNIIKSACPYCNEPQTINFDLVHYFMTMLSRERAFLIHEIHTLAKVYGWALNQILGLSRTIRRDLVKLATRDTTIALRQRRSA